MNPVDHPHGGVSIPETGDVLEAEWLITTNRVTTNILVRLLPSPDTPPKVKRPVLLPPEGRVFCVVPRRRRNKVAGIHGLMGWCYTGLLATIEGTAKSRRLVAPRQVLWHLAHKNLKAVLCQEVRYQNIRDGKPRMRDVKCNCRVRQVLGRRTVLNLFCSTWC